MIDTRQTIRRGLDLFDFEVTAGVVERFAEYLDCLVKWNRTYNLTAVRDPQQMIPSHLMDSLSLVSYLTSERILDVGTGAGFPGIPLAIQCPDRHFTLLDSNGKKTRFLTQVVIELDLRNVTVIQSRVEDYNEKFDEVVCRAFSSLDNIASRCQHLLLSDGRLVAMKAGKESLTAEGSMHIVAEIPVTVPLLGAERWLIVMEAPG